MTRKIAMTLAAIAMLFYALMIGAAWATIVVKTAYHSEPYRIAQKMCTANRTNYIMPLGGLPKPEMKGWRCYHVTDHVVDWVGPDILARRYLPFEKKHGWEIWISE